MHLLLLLSVILVIISSGLLTLIFENKKLYTALTYFISIIFAQIVLTFEILSYFSAVIPKNVIFINLLILVISFLLWNIKKHFPQFGEDFIDEICKVKKALKNDKWLMYSSVGFLICLTGSIVYAYFMPVQDCDAFSYHIARLPFWYDVKNLNHFETSDIRNLIMPINSEIFYFWAYSFIKSDIFVRFFSFFSYLMFIFSFRGFLKEVNISVKTSLWSILALAAMQNVMFSITGTETNLTIASLIMSCLFLFLYGIKNRNTPPLYFAGLTYALAVGTKTTALIMFPALYLLLISIAFLYKKKDFYKPLLWFTVFFIINFAIFASYNYILNYIEFNNFITTPNAMLQHSLTGGLKGFAANIIRYIFLFFDITGFPFSIEVWRIVTALSHILMALFGTDAETGSVLSELLYFQSGNNYENMCGFGVFGFLLFLPSLFLAFKNKGKSKRRMILTIFALCFIINTLILSALMGYMVFSIRFIMTFSLVSSPVLTLFFAVKNNKKFKVIISIIMIYTFTFSYYFYDRRYTPFLVYTFIKNKTVNNFKSKIIHSNLDYENNSQTSIILKLIQHPDKKIEALYFASNGKNIYLPKHVENEKFHIDFKLLETTEEKSVDWNRYDYIIVPNAQISTNIKDSEKYKKALLNYSTGENGESEYYEFDKGLFASCIYCGRDKNNFIWFNEPQSNYTYSKCYHKPDIFIKHGFVLFAKINEFNKKYDEQINIYKNINK